MGLKRLDNIGVVVDDLDAAIAFFAELGMEPPALLPPRARGHHRRARAAARLMVGRVFVDDR
jgi:catechol 2,3-dioxygenase-like lactoylglutathione lyase family enzyme